MGELLNKIYQKTRKMVFKTRGLFPQKLPITAKDFERFSKKLFFTYDIPDLPSYRHAIATMIMHLDPTTCSKSNYYFAKSIKKAQANEISYSVIQQIKEDAKKLIKETSAATETTVTVLNDENNNKITTTTKPNKAN